ncbi:MAG TPA: molybdopterin molybdotransferase MoeA [Candidatus Azoamicus sp.]
MINFFKSISILLNTSKNKYILLKTKKKNLNEVLNYISADDIFSNKNIPSFKNSAMDGYAIKFNDKYNKFEKPVFFNIIKTIQAGDFFEKKITYGNEALEIMTGARLPANFNTVIKYEDVLNKNKIGFVINKPFKKFENVKLIGEDIKIGEKIISQGKLINISDVTVLSTIGIKKINIFNYPDIFLINTGNEISDQNDSSNYISISNTSKAYIFSFLKNLNINIKNSQTIKDNFKHFINNIKKIWLINNISIFITTGAVSKGQSDFIPSILKLIGIDILFHSINIKPGKPILFGKFKNFVFFFCLPGNPISTMIGIRFFFHTFLMLILGQNLEEPVISNMQNNIKNKKDTFFKSVSYFENNNLINIISDNQESFKVKPLLKTNSFVFIKKNGNKKYIYFNYKTLI